MKLPHRSIIYRPSRVTLKRSVAGVCRLFDLTTLSLNGTIPCVDLGTEGKKELIGTVTSTFFAFHDDR